MHMSMRIRTRRQTDTDADKETNRQRYMHSMYIDIYNHMLHIHTQILCNYKCNSTF